MIKTVTISFLIYIFALNSIFAISGDSKKQSSTPKYTRIEPVKHILIKDSSKYYQGIIQIKTKNALNLTNDDKSFINSHINRILNQISTYRITKPYDYIFNNSKFKDYTGISRISEIFFKGKFDPVDVCLELENYDEIEYAAPLYKSEPCFVPNDSLYPVQDELQKIQAEKAWDISQGDTSVVIAIVDSEVDWMHEDLSRNIWTNPGEIENNGVDDDHNGKIDDVHGWDFVGGYYYNSKDELVFNEDNDTRIYDINSKSNHGTMVASCASAVTNNGKGLAAIGNKCMILPVKVRGDDTPFWRGHDGILYAASMGADIINCSWTGVGQSPADLDIVKQASLMGSLIMVSAGNSAINNDDIDYMTNNFPYVMYIGASNDIDEVARFSNFGITTGVFTPGNPVYSAVPYNKYMTINGTSLSSPIAAGIAGLVKSVHKDWTARQILHQIRSTSDHIFFKDDSLKLPLYYGRANAYKALLYNRTFSDSLTIPGIEFIDALIKGEQGTINTFEPIVIKLKLKNFLATANNLNITFSNLDSLIQPVTQAIHFDSLGTNEESDIELTVQLKPNIQWYENSTQIQVKYSSKDYTDFQLLQIPIAPPPKKNYSTNLFDVTTLTYHSSTFTINAIHASGINTLWACGEDTMHNAIVMKANSGGWVEFQRFYNATNSSCTYIFGIDDKNAFVVADHQYSTSTLHETTDGGESWTDIELNNEIQYIKSIYFWDNTNGILICTGDTNQIIIYKTIDNGNTWFKPKNFAIENLVDNKSYLFDLNSTFFFNNKALIGAYPNQFLISYNNGESWILKNTSEVPMFQKFLFINDDKGLAIVFHYNNPNENWREMIAFTNDGGNTWQLDSTISFEKIFSNAVNLYYNSISGKMLALGNNGRLIISEDKGYSWFPVDYPINYILKNATLKASAVSDGKRTRLWFAGDAIGYIDLDDIFNPIDNNSPIAYNSVYPNPANNEIKIQYYLNTTSNVRIRLFNAIGEEMESIDFVNVINGHYQTLDINCLSYPIGYYTYSIQAGSSISYGKFVITR